MMASLTTPEAGLSDRGAPVGRIESRCRFPQEGKERSTM
jgi:hypothetical protein